MKMNEEWRNELVTKGAVFDAQEVYMAIRPLDGYEDGLAMLNILRNLPSAQPQLDTCPIYGGMCGYPSNLCYECPRHEGAKERPQWWTEGLQPFAQPQRMNGKWVQISPAKIYECSICGKNVMTEDIDAYDFCHGCGADMRGEQDG